MDLKVPRSGVLWLAITVLLSLGLTFWLVSTLGGPGANLTEPYQVRAASSDVQQLEANAVVLIRGVKVGQVKSISVTGDRAQLTLAIDGQYTPIYRDAIVRIGQRTAIGEAFVDLRRGSAGAGALPSRGTISRVRETVGFDQAFSTLDEKPRAHAVSLLETLGRASRLPQTAQRWGATVHELGRTTHELRGLTTTLRQQQRDLGGFVEGSRAALQELGERERTLTSLVTTSRQTLGVFAGRQPDVATTLHELPPLLRTARGVLARVRPLVMEARPVVRDLAASSDALGKTFSKLDPVARDTRATISGLGRFNAAAVPLLRNALPVVEVARPFARSLEPILRNAVPLADYLSPRAPEFFSWFSGNRGAGAQGDSKSQWVRFFIFDDPGQSLGTRNESMMSRNAYPPPQDAYAPTPYKPGSYPRLLPYTPKGKR
jgi:phospholipid/cholesterol/gamma-HCH transport system substrate-binding protein